MAKISSNSKAPVAKKASNTKASTNGDGKGLSSQLRIMIAIAQQNRLGVEAPCRKKIASMADMKNAGSYNTILGRMKKKGDIEYPDKTSVVLTEAGKEVVAPHLPPEPQCNKDYHDELKKKIARAKVRQMFDLLADGEDHALAELAQLAGFEETSASFKVYVGCLNPNVEKFKMDDGAKGIRLKDECFPFGRGAE